MTMRKDVSDTDKLSVSHNGWKLCRNSHKMCLCGMHPLFLPDL